MQTVSAGDIARLIKRPDEDLTPVVDRIRNWVKYGLLTPAGAQNPGTGRHRHFDDKAVIEAAILNLLSRDYGVAGPRLVPFKGALNSAVKQLAKAEFLPEHKDIWLVIGPREGIEVPSKPSHVLSDVQFIDSVTRSRPVKAGLPERKLELPPLIGNRLLAVNLSSLFKHLGVPLAKAEALKRLAKEYPGLGLIERG
jgi:hypothetical protein